VVEDKGADGVRKTKMEKNGDKSLTIGKENNLLEGASREMLRNLVGVFKI